MKLLCAVRLIAKRHRPVRAALLEGLPTVPTQVAKQLLLSELSLGEGEYRKTLMEADLIPEGYHSVTPYLTASNALLLVEFILKAFTGTERERILRPDGSIMHTEVRVGDSLLMIGEPRGEWKPQPSILYLYVADVDATYLQALAAGGESILAPNTTFWGDRTSCVKDFANNQWWIATRKENLKPDEVQKRADAFFEQMAKNTA